MLVWHRRVFRLHFLLSHCEIHDHISPFFPQKKTDPKFYHSPTFSRSRRREWISWVLCQWTHTERSNIWTKGHAQRALWVLPIGIWKSMTGWSTELEWIHRVQSHSHRLSMPLLVQLSCWMGKGKRDWGRQQRWKTNVTPRGIHLQKLHNHNYISRTLQTCYGTLCTTIGREM